MKWLVREIRRLKKTWRRQMEEKIGKIGLKKEDAYDPASWH